MTWGVGGFAVQSSQVTVVEHQSARNEGVAGAETKTRKYLGR